MSAHSSAQSLSWALDIQGPVKDRYYDDEWAGVGTVCVAVRISFCFPSISGECSASSHPRDLRKSVLFLSNECGIISSDLKVMLTLCWTHWFGAASFQKRSMHSGQPVFMHSQGFLDMSSFLPDTPFGWGWKLQTLLNPWFGTAPFFSIRGMLVHGRQDCCSDQISTSLCFYSYYSYHGLWRKFLTAVLNGASFSAHCVAATRGQRHVQEPSV